MKGAAATPHDPAIAIPSALERAFSRMNGVAKQDIKFRIGDFLFRQKPTPLAPIKVYYDERKYCGKISNHQFHPVVGQCDFTRDILTILEDPKKAAIDHGKSNGSCAICGTALTDPASLLLGIGPVCLHNFGWADDDLEVEDL